MMNSSDGRTSNVKDFVHGSRALKPGEAVPDRLSWIALLGKGEMIRSRKPDSDTEEEEGLDGDDDLVEFDD